jgi:hypothetical protein
MLDIVFNLAILRSIWPLYSVTAFFEMFREKRRIETSFDLRNGLTSEACSEIGGEITLESE